MGCDYSYNCTKAEKLEDLGQTYNGDRMLFCRLEFENEHGYPLQPVEGVVVLRKYGATLETYAENVLSEDLSEEEFESKAKELAPKLALGDVGFDIHNNEEVAKMLA